MTKLERVQCAIDTLRESIRQGWFDIATKPLSKDQRVHERAAIARCEEELFHLLDQRDALNASGEGSEEDR
ncbi:hypothetical protein ACRBEV_24990 [Methylobacterium phyllosphaerae]